MGVSLPDIYPVGSDVGRYYKNGILVSPDIQSLPLTDSIKLGSIVNADDFP